MTPPIVSTIYPTIRKNSTYVLPTPQPAFDADDLAHDAIVGLLDEHNTHNLLAMGTHNASFLEWRATWAMKRNRNRTLRRWPAGVPLPDVEHLITDPTPTPESATITAEQVAQIRTLIANLPPRLATIARLLSEGNTCAEVARRLGVSRAAITQAKNRIRQAFEYGLNGCV